MYNTIPPKIASLQHRKYRIVVDPTGKRVGDKIKGVFRQTLILKCQKGIYARSKTRAPLANKFCTTSRCNTTTLQKKTFAICKHCSRYKNYPSNNDLSRIPSGWQEIHE